jgi:hypothetical protein
LTPLEWGLPQYDSKNYFKADPGLKSFVFTLENPRNFPARKFALKPEEEDKAIFCDSLLGPAFRGSFLTTLRDFSVSDRANLNKDSYTSAYALSSAADANPCRQTIFTGLPKFAVKEIEVFEITN